MVKKAVKKEADKMLTTDKKSNFIPEVTVVGKAPTLNSLLNKWGSFPTDPKKRIALRQAQQRELKKK